MVDLYAAALRLMLAAGAGLPAGSVIPDNEETPGTHPRRPYGTLLLIGEFERGETPTTEYHEGPDQVFADQTQHLTRHYSAEFHGKGALEYMKRARAWIASLDLGAAAAQTGDGVAWPPEDLDPDTPWPAFTVESIDEARNIDKLLSGDWEERWALEIVMEFRERRRYDLGRIDEVPLSYRRE